MHNGILVHKFHESLLSGDEEAGDEDNYYSLAADSPSNGSRKLMFGKCSQVKLRLDSDNGILNFYINGEVLPYTFHGIYDKLGNLVTEVYPQTFSINLPFIY